MSDIEDDIYFDAISTGNKVHEKNGSKKAETSDRPDAEQVNNRDTTAPNDSTTVQHTSASSGNNIRGAGAVNPGQGRVSQLASQFMKQSSDNTRDTNSDQVTSDANVVLHKIHKLNLPKLDLPTNSNMTGDSHKRAFILEEPENGTFSSEYSFAQPFPEDKPEKSAFTKPHSFENQGQTDHEGQDFTFHEGQSDRPADSFVDSVGYSHPNKGPENKPEVVQYPSTATDDKSGNVTEPYPAHINTDNQRNSPVSLNTVSENTENVENTFENNFENIEEENLYDSVHNSLNRKSPVSGFEVINHEHVAISNPQPSSSTSPKKHGRTAERKKMKQLAADVNYEWKRQVAKKKSRALKRPSKMGEYKTYFF